MADSLGYSYAASGFSERWGHYSPVLLESAIAGSILLGLRTAPPTLLSLGASVGLLVMVLATWLMMRRHDRRLCEACASRIPLNATEQASRFKRRFATVHAGTDKRIVIPYLVVLIGSNWLLTLPHGRWVWAIVQSSMIYLVMCHSAHRRLQPWCPWCSGGGGGEEVGDETPDLPRGRGRQLV